MNEPQASSSLLVFLFTDLVDSTGWKQSLGDAAYANDILQPHNDLCRRLLSEFPDANERNFTGDGFLVTFPSPSAAVQFGLRFHERLREYLWSDEVTRKGHAPETRIGIHLGEAIAYADADPNTKQVTGQAVDLAARIMGLAAGKQTLVTRHAFDSARQYVRDEGLSWLAHGQYRCKGSDDPLEVCEVGVPGRAPLAPPADSDKAKRVKIEAEDDTGSWRPAVGLPIPRRDGWIIEKKLGEGGFGEVWLARHQRTKERRVFKFCFDAERLRSFKRELTFFKLIKNELGERPDIAKLHEVQVEAPPYFLESEFVESGNLADWAEAQGGLEKIPLATRLRLMVETARAVAAAHSLGIIHKDLKPSNILIKLDRDGTPHAQLNDFGIGILADRTLLQKGAITETGFTESVMFGNDSSRTGTRLYSPPEANLGKPATTGFDVYALGVMLFQMVVGDLHRPLGTGWQEDVIAGDADDPLQSALLMEDISQATYGVPAKRLPGAALFADRVEHLEARRAERLAGIASKEQERLKVERDRRLKRLRWALAGSVALMVVMGGLGVYAWQAKNAAIRAEFEETIRANELTIALKKAEDAQKAEAKRAGELAIAIAKAEQSERAEKTHSGKLSVALKKTEQAENAEKQRSAELAIALKKAEEAEETEKNRSVQLKKERDITELALKEAERNLSNGRIFLAENSWNTTESAEIANDLIDAIPPAFRNWEWRYLKAKYEGRLFAIQRHGSGANSVVLSTDGMRIVSGSDDKIVRVWDARTGESLLQLKGHTKAITSVAISNDRKQIVSGSDDKIVRVWDARTGENLLQLKGHTGRVTCVAISNNGKRIVSGSSDNTVRVWDAKTGQTIRKLTGNIEGAEMVGCNHNASVVVAAMESSIIRVWDGETGQILRERTFTDGKRRIFYGVASVAINDDGTRIVSGINENTVLVWNPRTGEDILELKGHTGDVTSVAISADGTRIVSGSKDRTVRLWDAQSGKARRKLAWNTESVTGVAISGDGTRIVSAGGNDPIRVWDMRAKERSYGFDFIANMPMNVAINGDGTRIAISSLKDNVVRLWTVGSRQYQFELKGHKNVVTCLAFSADGTRIISGSADETVRVWDARTGKSQIELNGHTNSVLCVATSREGTCIVSSSKDKTILVWDARTGKSISGELELNATVESIAISSDGTRIVGSSGNTLYVWDALTGRCLLRLEGTQGQFGIRQRFDQEKVCFELNATIREITSVAISSDGYWIACGLKDKTIQVWNAKTGRNIVVLKGHVGRVTSVAISSDNTRIVSGSEDKTVRLWDMRNGQSLVELKGHSSALRHVAISDDASHIISVSSDPTFFIWGEKLKWDRLEAESELAHSEKMRRRYTTRPDPDWHIEQSTRFEKEGSTYAAALHRSFEQQARGVAAVDYNQFDKAYWHFISAALLKPKIPESLSIEKMHK